MARRQGRNAYRRELIAEFEAIFPHSVFRGIPVHGNAGWTPRKILYVSVIMFWVSGKTLEEQFSAARHLVQFLWPHWKVPVSYAGFVQAQQRWWPHSPAAEAASNLLPFDRRPAGGVADERAGHACFNRPERSGNLSLPLGHRSLFSTPQTDDGLHPTAKSDSWDSTKRTGLETGFFLGCCNVWRSATSCPQAWTPAVFQPPGLAVKSGRFCN